MGDRLHNWKCQSMMKKTVDLIGLAVILAGLGVSIFMNCVGRSLWFDEAMLAYSFSKRSLLTLTDGVFEWEQSAPVLYLYLVKLLTVLFGNTEFVLRSFSILSFAAALFLSAVLAKRLFGLRYPILVPAFLANMNFMLQYSNVFKQYVSECVWVLLVLAVYYRYREKGMSWRKMALSFMVFLWGANPACFFIGGALLYEFLCGIAGRDRKRAQRSVLAGIGVGLSFAVYYFYWLRETAGSGAMQSYWGNADFPLIPRSIADLKLAQAMLYEIFITFREARLFIAALVAAAFLIGLFWERNRYCAVILLGFLIALFASWIHMFPVADRLWCFSYPLFAILAFYALDRMTAGGAKAQLAALFLSAALLLTNNGILVYRHSENVYWKGEEANFSIDWLRENLEPGEKVYVYYQSIPVTKYKIGYETDRIGETKEENIIWGTETLDKEKAQGDIEKVLSQDRCYILASHAPAERIDPLLDAAAERGSLEIVTENYETPLYYYAKSPADRKGRAAYELLSQEEEGDTCYVTLRIWNTGTAYLNSQYDEIRIACREREDIGTNLWGNLAPGAYFDMPLQFDWKGDTEVRLQLRNGERYWYEELGTVPLTVRKGE